MKGWCNDISSYANWLYEYINLTELDEIETVKNDEEYSNLLFKVAKKCLNEDYLKQYKEEPRKGSIYEATGPFGFSEQEEDEDEYDDWNGEDGDWFIKTREEIKQEMDQAEKIFSWINGRT